MQMYNRIIMLVLASLLALGCGGRDGSTGDAGPDLTDTKNPDAMDVTDTADDSAPDTTGDTPSDTREEEPGPDATGEPDMVDDASDAEAEPDGDVSGCLPLEADFTAVESWVICFMGSGTHVAFTIRYTNPSTTCDITGVTVTGGSLRLSSDGSALMTFGTTPPVTSFSGTVAAGSSTTVDYHASDGSLDTRAHDGAATHLTADVSSSGGSLSLTSADTTHTCVY